MTPALCAIVGAAAWPPPPDRPPAAADAVRAALADCRRLDPAAAAATRYLSAHHRPAAEWAAAYAVTSYHVNSLSREGVVVRPRKVTAWLWAVDVRDYGWGVERFGKLAYSPRAVEPYFHVEPLDVTAGKPVRPLIGAPWLPAAEYAELVAKAGTAVPVVRADWFLNRTGAQEGRDDFGYLDFLELKSRADAERLAGLDRKKAEEIYREQAAIAKDTGVAALPRQLFRYSTVAGCWWESRDSKAESNGTGKNNAVRLKLGDYKHDAEEIVATLPNRLPFYYLSDAQGVQQRSAPPDIASDRLTRNNDARVHVSVSCVRCHTSAGLKVFDDYARKVYRGGSGVALGATDDRLFRRLRSVYLGPLERAFRADADAFGEAITEASGLKPEALAKAYADEWSRYLDDPVTPARAAAECGTTEAELLGRLQVYAARTRAVDPVLAAYLAREPEAVRREQFEEIYGLLMLALGNPGREP